MSCRAACRGIMRRLFDAAPVESAEERALNRPRRSRVGERVLRMRPGSRSLTVEVETPAERRYSDAGQ